MPRNPDEIPEISGSPAGFVALVVFLGLIIVFSCVGVFVLLRQPAPDPYERHARRVLAGAREEQQTGGRRLSYVSYGGGDRRRSKSTDLIRLEDYK